MKIKKAEHFLRLLLSQDTTQPQALGLLRTVNQSQLDSLAEIAHNLIFNQEVASDYARKRRRLFEELASKKRRRDTVRRHSLVILRALLRSRKILLEALEQ